jgi:hypothetical protein
MRRTARIFWSAVLGLMAVAQLRAQDINIVLPIPVVEQRLARDSFRILEIRGSRRPGDRTSRAMVAFEDSSVLQVKFAAAPATGETFNNSPRYEVGAYEFQKLFLDEPDYVVPPTILRVFDLEWYKLLNPSVSATFSKSTSVLTVLQYWLSSVTQNVDSVFDLKRFERDTAYARHLGNLNLVTHLIKHNDANIGNILLSTAPINPRLFSVDNGLAFGTAESDRGVEWRNLRIPRVPAYTVERLRKITRADLERTLAVLAEYELQGTRLVPVEKTENFNRGQGVRRKENRIQFGLTKFEIDGVENRIKNVIERVDRGRLKTF